MDFLMPSLKGRGTMCSMQLSLFSDFSLRLLMYGALKGDSFRVAQVSAAYGISRHHLAKVVQRLSQLGYLVTRRGRGGGIALAQPPTQVRIGALVRAMEEPSALVECFDPVRNTCPLNGHCRLKGLLAEANKAFYECLDRHTLHDLVVGGQRPDMASVLGLAPRAKKRLSASPRARAGSHI